MKTPNPKAPTAVIRCAIYTRKSTEEGLEKEFNSLDAQRESGELFVRSQAGEGWTLVPDAYDDGGFTGGNMERPALRRLMLDIEAGKVDAVVVYKVDRLSRSLLDFARMMQVFDSRKVSFVSVTQQFNTATSMGRLVLNVLLSFAQFEREIISERTRDKIAATRRKGKWAGGHPLLGYDIDPQGFKLLVNPAEAERVRGIFQMYLDRESLMPAVQALAEKGWVNKRWTTRKGHERGGLGFTRTSLYKLLTNVAYAGKVRYKDEVHPGEHPAIVDADLWQRVQAMLGRNGRTGGAPVRNKFGALLKGLLRCVPCGAAMTPSHSTRQAEGIKRYRYYVCSSAQKRVDRPGQAGLRQQRHQGEAPGVRDAEAAGGQQHEGTVRQLAGSPDGTDERDHRCPRRPHRDEYPGTRLRGCPHRPEGCAARSRTPLRDIEGGHCVSREVID